MDTMTVTDFLIRLKLPDLPVDHHFTGPEQNQQPEGHGAVWHQEGVILFALAHKLGGPVLEIGADQGVSTRYIHEGLARRRGVKDIVWSIDINHKWADDPAWPRRRRVTADGAKWRCPEAGANFAWAFIDGSHQYDAVRADIVTTWSHGCRAMLFHDARPDMVEATKANVSNESSVRRAVFDEFAREYLKDWTLTYLPTGCGMIYAEGPAHAF
jgi:methyltransferase family protein